VTLPRRAGLTAGTSAALLTSGLLAGCSSAPSKPATPETAATSYRAGQHDALEALVTPETAGDPMSRMKWTRSSLPTLAGEMKESGERPYHVQVVLA
jgi:hypothetical protein